MRLLLALLALGLTHGQVDAAPFDCNRLTNCCTKIRACLPTTCPPTCPPGPVGPKGDTGLTGAQGSKGDPGVCPACPPSGGGPADLLRISPNQAGPGFPVLGIVNSQGRWIAGVSNDGVVRHGMLPDIPRNTAVKVGDQYRAKPMIGFDILVKTAGTTGTVQPLAIPTLWETEASYPAGARIIRAYGYYEPAFRTNTACTTGEPEPSWPWIGGSVQDGTCIWTAVAFPRAELEAGIPDGTAVLRLGGWTATQNQSDVEFGNYSLNRPTQRNNFGDNGQESFLVDRGYEDGDPVGWYSFAIHGMADGRTDRGNLEMPDFGYAPSFVMRSWGLGAPKTKPKVRAYLSPKGKFPPGWGFEFSLSQKNPDNGGISQGAKVPGINRLVRKVQCPAKDPANPTWGCAFEVSAPNGICQDNLFQNVPCTLDSQCPAPQKCTYRNNARMVLNIGSDYYSWRVLELAKPSQVVQVFDTAGEVETESHKDYSGYQLLSLRGSMFGMGVYWKPGEQTCVGHPVEPKNGPGNGNYYKTVGTNCDAEGENCDYMTHQACAKWGPMPPVWRMDNRRSCTMDETGTIRICVERAGFTHITEAVAAPPGACQERYYAIADWRAPGYQPQGGVCDGRPVVYGPWSPQNQMVIDHPVVALTKPSDPPGIETGPGTGPTDTKLTRCGIGEWCVPPGGKICFLDTAGAKKCLTIASVP